MIVITVLYRLTLPLNLGDNQITLPHLSWFLVLGSCERISPRFSDMLVDKMIHGTQHVLTYHFNFFLIY